MKALKVFEAKLQDRLRERFTALRTPHDIQSYLDSLPYIGEERDRCPLDVMQDQQCHCLDGGLLAALAMRQIGYPGLLMDLVPSQNEEGDYLDDDHVLAVFRRHGAWGAVAKSNYPWLRYREPVYRSLRELAMSYFEVYFNVQGMKSLRGYRRLLDIAKYDHLDYAWSESGAAKLFKALYRRATIPLVSQEAAAELQPVDERAFRSGTLGVDMDWVFRPE